MPHALQLVSGFFTAGGAGLNVATSAAGDTFAVPSFDIHNSAYLEQVFAAGATTDFVRIRSPRLHDANQGMRLFAGTTKNRPLLPYEIDERLYPSDTPIVEIDATGAGSGNVLLLYSFDDLPGVAPRLASWAEVASRYVHMSGVEVDVTSGAIGQWGNGVAINANFDNFEAGADYAFLGWSTNVAVAGISVLGKDTGNLRVGGPGDADPILTRKFFVQMSSETGKPYIPIIAANNKASTLVQAVDVAAATAVKVTLLLAQLA